MFYQTCIDGQSHPQHLHEDCIHVAVAITIIITHQTQPIRAAELSNSAYESKINRSTHALIHSLSPHSPTHPLTVSLIHSLTNPRTHTLIHSPLQAPAATNSFLFSSLTARFPIACRPAVATTTLPDNDPCSNATTTAAPTRSEQEPNKNPTHTQT